MTPIPEQHISLADAIRYGDAMVQKGKWTVDARADMKIGTVYIWRSPRGVEYKGISTNAPSTEAIMDALRCKDIS